MTWFNNGLGLILEPRFGSVGEPPMELLLDAIAIGLMVTTYAQDVTDDNYDDITTEGIVALNYVEPGAAGSHLLGSKAVTVDAGGPRAEFDALDLVFTAIGGGPDDTFDFIVVCRQLDTTPTEATTRLLAAVAVPTTLTNGGNITMVWNAEAILQITG